MAKACTFVFVCKAAPHEAPLMAPSEKRMCGSVARIELECISEKDSRYSGVLWHLGSGIRHGAKIKVVRIKVFWAFSPGPLNLRPLQVWFDYADDLIGYLILKIEDVFERAVVFVGPEMRPCFGLD